MLCRFKLQHENEDALALSGREIKNEDNFIIPREQKSEQAAGTQAPVGHLHGGRAWREATSHPAANRQFFNSLVTSSRVGPFLLQPT